MPPKQSRTPNVEDEAAEDDETEAPEDAQDEDISEDLDNELDQFMGQEIDFSKSDPMEKINRVLYGIHRGVDLMFIRPVALTYSKVLPKPVQSAVANFVTNLTAPLRFLCWLLQGKIEEAGKTSGKFVINTFLGLGGIFNVSAKLGLHENHTGFAETFKKWGVSHGPYVVVPGIGPGTMRTAIGMLFDSFVDPVFLLTLNRSLPYNDNRRLMWYDTGAQVTGLLISRAQLDPLYDDIEKNSVNKYTKLRNMVLQQPINK